MSAHTFKKLVSEKYRNVMQRQRKSKMHKNRLVGICKKYLVTNPVLEASKKERVDYMQVIW